MEDYKHLGVFTYSIQEEISSRLKSVNACYDSVQSFLSSSFDIQKFKDEDIQNYNFVFVWV